jgi:murein DD-endopeptidase MepM/ murein hydrolase activator NlpD
MRGVLLAAVLLVACASAPAQGPSSATVAPTKPRDVVVPPNYDIQNTPMRVPASEFRAPTQIVVDGVPPLSCAGRYEQGGFIICNAPAGTSFYVDGTAIASADQQGKAIIGFDRDAKPIARIEARAGAVVIGASDAIIKPQTYNIQRVDGLPQNTVTPSDPALLERIRREAAIKAKGFASRVEAYGYQEPWIWPIDGRLSGAWGNQRVLNGVPASPHMGVDIAAPSGTPIKAPASGVVSLAQPDLHYEGGLVMIDHGQGLVSLYLHMSRLDVKAGDVVVRGQVIGAVGAKGRATGPHLCWRMKWRDRNLDPALMPAEALKPLIIPAPSRP